MGFQRQFARNQIRKKYGNKKLQSVWRYLQQQNMKSIIDRTFSKKIAGNESLRDSIFTKMWKKALQRIANATKKKKKERKK